MEDLNQPLLLLLNVKRSLEQNQTTLSGVHRFLARHRGKFRNQVEAWLYHLKKETKAPAAGKKMTFHEMALLALIERGLRGESIYAHLKDLEVDLNAHLQEKIDAFLQKLPILMMIPLTLFLFPAFLTLLIGPIILQLMHSLT